MSKMVGATVNQVSSAIKKAEDAGIQHGVTAVACITVGVTRSNVSDKQKVWQRRPVLAHFCSSIIVVETQLVAGDGQEIPKNCAVRLPNGLPVIQEPSFMRFTSTIRSNGALNFGGPRAAYVVAVPKKLLNSQPWVYAGGAEECAEELGCASVDEMFEKFGVLVS